MFLWKKRNGRNNIETGKTSGVSLWLTFHNCHYDLDVNTGFLRYENVISSRDGGKRFPEGYFTEKTARIGRKGMNEIKLLIQDLIPALHVKTGMDFRLPCGASPDASIGINHHGTDLCFCNLRPIRDGSMVESIPIPDAFVRLAQELGKYCDFPKFEIKPTFVRYSKHVSDHLKVRDVVQNSQRMAGYKRSFTGASEYEFYNEDKERICRMYHLLQPNSYVSIEISDAGWESEFENCTIGPGITRYVMDSNTGDTVAKIVYRESGRFEVNDSIDVFCDIEKCSFFAGDIQIALIEKTKGQGSFIPGTPEDEYEPIYDAYIIRGSIDKDLFAMILAFPVLRFG